MTETGCLLSQGGIKVKKIILSLSERSDYIEEDDFYRMSKFNSVWKVSLIKI